MTGKKITKKTYYTALVALATAAEEAGVELTEGITYEGLAEFAQNELDLLDKKADAAKKRQAEKKVEGDELREKVLNVLSDTDYMTIDDVVAAIGDPDVRKNMVVSRLTQLGENGTQQVEKTQVTVEATTEGGKSRKATAYRRIAMDVE